jgi:hypothetical protein
MKCVLPRHFIANELAQRKLAPRANPVKRSPLREGSGLPFDPILPKTRLKAVSSHNLWTLSGCGSEVSQGSWRGVCKSLIL